MNILKNENLYDNLDYTNLQDTVPTWSSNTTYGVETEVNYQGNIWSSTAENNTDVPSKETTKWYYERVSNSRAWGDNYPTTESKISGEDLILRFININQVGDIVVGNAVGQSIKIKITNLNNEVILDKEVILSEEFDPVDHFEYWNIFEEPKVIKNHIETVTSIELGLTVEVTITQKYGSASLGFLSMGRGQELGCTLEKMSRKGNSDRKIIEDEYGRKILIGGRGWVSNSYTLWFDTSWDLFEADKITRDIMQKMSVFIGAKTENVYNIIGFFDEYTLDPMERTIDFIVYSSDKY